MELKLVQSHDRKQGGLFVEKNENEVVFISSKTGAFYHININEYYRNYQIFDFDYNLSSKWTLLLTRKRIIYDNINYEYCCHIIDELLKLLTTKNKKSKIKFIKDKECCICFENFTINDNIISFHLTHNKHLCCQSCYVKYGKTECPICRTSEF